MVFGNHTSYRTKFEVRKYYKNQFAQCNIISVWISQRNIKLHTENMNQKLILTFFTLILYCSAKQTYFELDNDPDYPQLITVSNVRYELINNRYLDIDCTVTVYEEINDATNVSSKSGKIISIFFLENKQKFRQDKMFFFFFF